MKNGLLFIIGTALGTTLFLLATFFLITGDPAELTILNAHGYLYNNNDQTALSNQEAIQINSLLSKGYIVSTNDLISDVTAFYSTIIEILVVIIGILGFVAFMYVKGASEAFAEEKAQYAVETEFKSKEFHDLLETTIKTNLEPLTTSLDEDLQDLRSTLDEYDELSNFEKRIIAIEEKIASNDTDEMDHSGQDIEAD